jgi:hypothetical protein
MLALVHHEPTDIDFRLKELGLQQEHLRESVMQGMLLRSECTSNDPPLFPGYSAWARTVRTLREKLIPLNWNRSDDGGYSLCVNPDSTLAIAVATGDENTGNPREMPLTKSPKGPRTQLAIEINQHQSSLFDDLPDIGISDLPNSDRTTWVLLQHYDQGRKEVRFELSLPMNYSGKIDGWSERIIFGAVPFDQSLSIPVPMLPNLPDIDVPLRRRS